MENVPLTAFRQLERDAVVPRVRHIVLLSSVSERLLRAEFQLRLADSQVMPQRMHDVKTMVPSERHDDFGVAAEGTRRSPK